MNRRHLLLTFLASAGAMVAGSAINAGASRGHTQQQNIRKSLLIGSAAAPYDFCMALADEFKKRNSGIDTLIEKGDSLQGVIAVKRGAIDLAMISRQLSNEENDSTTFNFLVARSNIDIIVHPDSPVKNLTAQQVRGLLSGEITNWSQVGGSNASINIFSRTRGSSTRQFVEEVVLEGGDIAGFATEVETTALMAAAVAADPFAIGYISTKDNSGDAKFSSLAIDGVMATTATVLSGRYPYTHSFYLLLSGEQSGIKYDFVKFACSDAGQAIASKLGLVPVY